MLSFELKEEVKRVWALGCGGRGRSTRGCAAGCRIPDYEIHSANDTQNPRNKRIRRGAGFDIDGLLGLLGTMGLWIRWLA